MFNPFDGLLLATGTTVTTVFWAAGTSTVPAAVIGGCFMVLCKLIELWWKTHRDKHVRKLEQQLREARTELQLCTRAAGHKPPCNGLPRFSCGVLPK